MLFDQPLAIGTPFSPLDILFGLVAASAFFFSVFLAVARWPDRRVILAALLTKLCAGFFYSGIVVYYFASGSDSLGYHDAGIELADLLRGDLASGTSAYFSHDPFFDIGGNSASRMDSFSGLIHFICLDSFLASSFLCALLAFIGQLLIYRTFCECYPDPRVRLWWQVGILFFPTLTFWSSGLLKDPMGILGLGLALWGVHCIFHAVRARDVLVTALGLYILFMFRAMVLPLFLLAIIPWFLETGPRLRGQTPGVVVKLLVLCTFALGAVFAMTVLAEIEPRYSLSKAPETIVHQRQLYVYDPNLGKSTDTESILVDPSWSGLILAWPASMVFMLYRPFLWEASASPFHLLAAMENLLLLALTARAAWKMFSNAAVLRDILRSPMFLTCVCFVLLAGFAVGLSTPNLGTISRYRIPVIPFIVGIVTIIEYHSHRRQRVDNYE